MLNPIVIPRARSVRRRTPLLAGVLLRVILITSALAYVLGPTVAQWVSFEHIRHEVAVARSAEVPRLALDPTSVSPVAQDLLEEVAPERLSGLVGPGLVAADQIEDGAARLGGMLVEVGLRTAQVLVAAFVLLMLSVRWSKTYRPRHAGGAAAAVFARRA